MKKILFLICLVGLFGGCSSSDDYEFQKSKCETAADKIYELADDYGLNVKVGSLYSSLSPDKVDLEKFEMLFRGLARLKGTHVVEGVKQNNSIEYKCVSNQKRRRSMSPGDTSIYDFGVTDLNDDFYGGASVTFHHYGNASNSYDCDVYAWIDSGHFLGRSDFSLYSKRLVNRREVVFTGEVSYTFEYYGIEGNYHKNDHKCAEECTECPKEWDITCKVSCLCDTCYLADTEYGGYGEKVTVSYDVIGDCNEYEGNIVWK